VVVVVVIVVVTVVVVSVSAVNVVLVFVMAACQLCWPPAILFYRCSLDLSSFFRHLISEVAWPIIIKLCLMFDGDPDL